jgi:hypothetical protein
MTRINQSTCEHLCAVGGQDGLIPARIVGRATLSRVAGTEKHSRSNGSDSAAEQPTPSATGALVPVRRAPNIARFLITGALVGVLAGLIFSALRPTGDGYSETTATGFVVVLTTIFGVLIAAVLAVILDGRKPRFSDQPKRKRRV